jgi:hypothetical protein
MNKQGPAELLGLFVRAGRICLVKNKAAIDGDELARDETGFLTE